MQKAKRKFGFRFSLRLALLAFTVGCIGLGLKTRQMRIERKARLAIESAGGTVNFDYEIDENGDYIKDGKSSVPSWALSALGEECFHRIRAVHLKGWVTPDYLPDDRISLARVFRREVDDQTLEHIARLTQLRSLSLQMTDIENNDLRHLSKLRQLRRLRIDGNRIDNRGLKQLEDLAVLEHVDVRWTRIAADNPQQLAIPIETLAGSVNSSIVVPPDFWDKMEGELAWRAGVAAIPDAAQGNSTERQTEGAVR